MNDVYALRRIEIVASGVLPSHAPGFGVDYRDGNPEFGFVYFHSPVVLEDCNGRLLHPAGTAIFYLPHEPRFYYPVEGCLQHTWFLAIGPGVEQCLRDYSIPTFKGLYLQELPFLLTFINDVRQENVALQEYYQDAITDLFHDFYCKIGVILTKNSDATTSKLRNRAKTLNELRLQVHADIARKWTVREMAESEGLSPSRFAIEYRMEFGVSPIDDLIDARINRAEYMLTHLTSTIKQIAKECGFNSEEHFSRVFYSRRGCSPGKLRKR